jgi:hypothetical protein
MYDGVEEYLDVLAHNMWQDENDCVSDCDGYCGDLYCPVRIAAALARFGEDGEAGMAGRVGDSSGGEGDPIASDNSAAASEAGAMGDQEEWCIV